MLLMGGKVAIITGAASERGIGFATACALARAGAKVVLTDIDGDGVCARAQALGSDAIGLRQDVSDDGGWQMVFGEAVRAFGRLDVLVNNAGVVKPSPIADVSLADWRWQIEINLTATFLGAQTAIRLMREQRSGGSIINMSSIAGIVGVPGCAAYSASKGGLRLLTKSLALEVAREGIRINSIHPGLIWTGMQEGSASPEQLEQMRKSVPMRTLGEPNDIAAMALFLVSDQARYITGAEFIVDGGMTAQAGMVMECS